MDFLIFMLHFPKENEALCITAVSSYSLSLFIYSVFQQIHHLSIIYVI